MDDWQLLREYVDRGSEPAFTALVKRHLNLVYSAARRRLGDSHAAEEVAQSVFCLLASKARRLGPDTALVSWLYQTACFKASKHWRGETRRRQREQEAALMSAATTDETHAAWLELAPHLDDAMNDLAEQDRVAILQRFFQGKPLREVGEALGIGEDAARMRVNRALEKLRSLLESKGAVCSSAVLATALSGQAVEAAPASVAHSVQTAALAAAKIASAPSLLITILTFMAKAKMKSIGLIGIGVVAGLTLGLYLNNRSRERVPEPLASVASQSHHAQPPVQSAFRRPSRVTPAEPAQAATPLASAIDNLRRVLFSPDPDNMWPSSDLIRALQALGPTDAAHAVPLLIQGLQLSQHTNVQRRAVFALIELAVAADRGKWAKTPDGMPVWTDKLPEGAEWQQIDAEPLRLALLEALPLLRERMRSSSDSLIQTAAIKAANTISPQPELLPDIVEAMKTARGHRGAIVRQSKEAFARHPDAARRLLESLFNESDEELRIAAACSYAALLGSRNSAALDILTQGLGKRWDQRSSDNLGILDAIKTYGADARPYLSDLIQRAETLFQLPPDEAHIWELRDRYCSTLAAIDPELRNRIPELDQWFREQDQLAALKVRVANPAVTIPELTDALNYRETRYDALKRLADMGPAAAEALPALRKTLREAYKFGENENALGSAVVVDTIRKIDPSSLDPK
jgi:RNA polymerase sigma factor (sigma-70 family)